MVIVYFQDLISLINNAEDVCYCSLQKTNPKQIKCLRNVYNLFIGNINAKNKYTTV